ncbi:hypothetical protein KC19_10G096600 [Ceratodon purpureus]|uniref:Peptidoglycan beta-N-acetylmuramidase NamZ N-terminal domain-containing protein n=1 Tax=Ceratodon purpureus TaxID=3225 RepID=A0A8T0GJY0_CERPU|nr:hypothetical protein KC19_10G096600 [Ceratodon purpureus]
MDVKPRGSSDDLPCCRNCLTHVGALKISWTMVGSYITDESGLVQVDLEVVSMEGWHRSMLFFETKLVWVPPSPNIPSANSALLYMGMCLFEVRLLRSAHDSDCASVFPMDLASELWIYLC